MADLVDLLIDQGFEVLQHDDGTVRVCCHQCAPTVINGKPCHETGCPTDRAARVRRAADCECGDQIPLDYDELVDLLTDK